MIRKGAHQLSWGTDLHVTDVLSRLQQAKDLDCDAFEVFLSGNYGSSSTVKEAIKKTDLTLVGCAIIREGIDGDPLSTDETKSKRAEDAIKGYISSLKEMGGSMLVGPLANVLAQSSARPPTEEELEAGIKTFRNVARFAAEKEVQVAIEPIQWSEMPWPNTIEDVLIFIDNVEAADDVPKGILGVLADIYHMNRMEENWLKALKEVLAAGKLFHVHVAGPNRTPPRIGQHISWSKLVSALKNAGWEGIITIESFGAECNLPYEVVGPGERLPAEEVIATGVATLEKAGLRIGY